MGPSDAASAAALSAALSALAHAAAALAAAARALQDPAASGPSLPLPTPQPHPDAPALVDAVNEFLLAKARSGRSDRYLRQLRVSLRSFVGGRSRAALDALGPGDIEKWLGRSGWAARTRRGYLADLRTFWTWCERRGWARGNPAAAVDVPQLGQAAPGIVTPDQAAAVLEHAARVDPGAARVLAVRLFAGIRTAESLRLVESDLVGGFVRVEAAKSKTRARRLVPITPTLRAWLALDGELPVSEKRMRRTLARFAATLPPNWARHSFVSYRLAATGSASQTALEAGHSEAVLFRAYRELATPEQARRFWDLRPPGPAVLQRQV